MKHLIKIVALSALLASCLKDARAKTDFAIISNSVTINVRNFHVLGDGRTDDYQAIQNAVNSTKSYNTSTVKVIYFPSGAYRISKAISTVAESTIFKFANGAKLILSQNTTGGILIKNNNCAVYNGVILGNGVSAPTIYTGYGIMLVGVSNCKISGCTLEKISGCSIFLIRNRNKGCGNDTVIENKINHPAISIGKSTDGAGVLLGYSGTGYFHKNNLIENNVIDGSGILDVGIAILAHGNHNTIRGNTVQNCLSYGILAYETKQEDSTLTDTYVLNNIVKNIGASNGTTTKKGMGIYLMKSQNSIVKGNTIINTMINSDRSETLASGAIAISASTDCQIANNIINLSAMYGIVNAYGFNNSFSNNTISNTAKAAIYLINTNNNKIIDNRFKYINGGYIIKGIFGNTSRKDFASNGLLHRFRGVNTGNKILISNNIFNTNNKNMAILNFSNFPDSRIGKMINFKNYMEHNIITGNQITGNNKFKDAFIITQNNSNSNKIFNNINK